MIGRHENDQVQDEMAISNLASKCINPVFVVASATLPPAPQTAHDAIQDTTFIAYLFTQTQEALQVQRINRTDDQHLYCARAARRRRVG